MALLGFLLVLSDWTEVQSEIQLNAKSFSIEYDFFLAVTSDNRRSCFTFILVFVIFVMVSVQHDVAAKFLGMEQLSILCNSACILMHQ